MILSVIRELAEKYSTPQIEAAAESFEKDRSNTLQVRGKDEGEILSNLLMAAVVRKKMDAGLSLSDAVREHSKTIQSIISPIKK